MVDLWTSIFNPLFAFNDHEGEEKLLRASIFYLFTLWIYSKIIHLHGCCQQDDERIKGTALGKATTFRRFLARTEASISWTWYHSDHKEDRLPNPYAANHYQQRMVVRFQQDLPPPLLHLPIVYLKYSSVLFKATIKLNNLPNRLTCIGRCELTQLSVVCSCTWCLYLEGPETVATVVLYNVRALVSSISASSGCLASLYKE